MLTFHLLLALCTSIRFFRFPFEHSTEKQFLPHRSAIFELSRINSLNVYLWHGEEEKLKNFSALIRMANEETSKIRLMLRREVDLTRVLVLSSFVVTEDEKNLLRCAVISKNNKHNWVINWFDFVINSVTSERKDFLLQLFLHFLVLF
jgi:hypothetical protein